MYEEQSPEANKVLQSDGSVIAPYTGIEILPADPKRAEIYKQMSAKANKLLQQDGSIIQQTFTSSGVPTTYVGTTTALTLNTTMQQVGVISQLPSGSFRAYFNTEITRAGGSNAIGNLNLELRRGATVLKSVSFEVFRDQIEQLKTLVSPSRINFPTTEDVTVWASYNGTAGTVNLANSEFAVE